MTPLRVLAAVALCLAATACGERTEPVGPAVSLYPITVRGAGDKPVALARRPKRIAVLTAGGAELVEALGAGERLVAAPGSVARSLGTHAVSVVQPSGLVDVAAVAAVRPDVVVAAPDLDAGELAELDRRSNAPIYLQPDRSLRDVRRAALELGLLVGKPVAARRLASSLADRAAKIERAVAPLPRVRVFVDAGFLTPPAPDSLVADLVRRAGGDVVAPDGGSTPLAPCRVVALSPDVVVRLVDEDSPRPPRRQFRRCRRGASATPKVAMVPSDLVTRAGPKVADGLAALARVLHPDARL
ncbi:MAG: ABC transporter substrate-binding protein [Thermoleophilia bacterium]|nr:ABC transporter substrate-binding protein [Thermoleophilia bacterium]MDQ3859628.1 ABC transporter substrate-binding protein [Actinomycetota bacterium]